jgi:hypothetical protein
LAADAFVVIGDTTVARRVCSSLAQRGHEVRHVPGPDDDELRETLDGTSVRGIAILTFPAQLFRSGNVTVTNPYVL